MTVQAVGMLLRTIEPAKACIQQVALGTEPEQVVVYLIFGNVFVDLYSHREPLQVCAELSNLQAALVGF